jgi:hypothetical protein
MFHFILCRVLINIAAIALVIHAKAETNKSIETSNTRKYSIHYDCFLSASLFFSKNKSPQDISGLYLFESINIRFTRNKKNSKNLHEFRNELSYFKYTDSIWIKNKDKLFLSLLWIINPANKIKNSFLINIKTQNSNTWEYSYNSKINQIQKKWISGPFLPIHIIAGYGINLIYLKNSYLNISFATFKVNLLPKNERLSPEIKIQWESDKAIIQTEYGFNIQGTLKHELQKKIVFENKTSFFTTGNDFQKTNFDIQNIISIKLNRIIKIRLENKFIYDLMVSKKVLSRYELLIGFNFEN